MIKQEKDRLVQLAAGGTGEPDELKAENESLSETEESLLKSEQLFSELFHQSPVTNIITIPFGGIIADVNLAFEQNMEYTRDEVIGKTTIEIGLFDDLQDRNKLVDILKEKGTVSGYECGFRTKTGKLYYGLLSIVFIQIKDKSYQHSTIIDITGRKLAEEALRKSETRLRRAELASKSGNWELHLDTGMMIGSEGAAKIYGVMMDEFEYTVIKTFVLPEFRPMLDVAMKQLLEADFQYDVEFKIKAGDTGEIKDIHSIAQFDKDKRIVFGIIQDITDRKQAEQLLIESEANARAIMEATEDVLILMNKDGIILDCNEVHAQRLSLTRKEILGKNVFDILPPEVAESRKKLTSQVLTIGKPYHGEDSRAGYSNEFSIYPIFVQNKITDRIAVFAQDITERKQAEKMIKENLDRLNRTEQLAHLGAWELDVATQKLVWSDEVYRIFGLQPQEFGATHEAFLESVHPDDREALNAAYFSSVQQNKNFYEIEHRVIRRHTGEIRYVYEKCEHVRDASGQIVRSIGMVYDITGRKLIEQALKDSEAHYRLLTEGVTDVVWKQDINYKFTYISPADERLRGYRADEVIGRYATEVFTPEGVEVVMKLIQKRQEDEQNGIVTDGYIFQAQQRCKDGGMVWTEIITTPERDENGVISGYHGISRDITERKNAEIQLNQYAGELKAQVATKDKFFNIIAHDLKSPFNSIVGFSNILIEQVKKKDYQGIEQFAGIVQSSSQRAMDLLMNLLEWSRSQTGRIEFSPEYIEMVTLVNEITELLGDSVRQKSITILSKLPGNVLVFADKAMISTVLRNLISNAIKFTHPGGQITFSAEFKPMGMLFSVSDNGVGIKEEALGKLFRIEETYSTRGTQNERGTGLGLILCKEFIEKHGGRIWVESEFGKGSTFCFTIPSA